jgi:hypothetical protein
MSSFSGGGVSEGLPLAFISSLEVGVVRVGARRGGGWSVTVDLRLPVMRAG